MVTDLFKWVDKETKAELIKEGKIEEKYKIVVEMLRENVKIEDIMKFTDLSKKEILNLENKLKTNKIVNFINNK